jgi:hypothetical protein
VWGGRTSQQCAIFFVHRLPWALSERGAISGFHCKHTHFMTHLWPPAPNFILLATNIYQLSSLNRTLKQTVPRPPSCSFKFFEIIFSEKGACFSNAYYQAPISVASRSKAWVCGRLFSGIVGSNPAADIDVCLLRVLCVVGSRVLRRADHSASQVLPSVVCRSSVIAERLKRGP